MSCVIDHPQAYTFTRTSYVSAPSFWREMSPVTLAGRIEQLLVAHYRIRAATLDTPPNGDRMLPFAFDFEWVEDGPTSEADEDAAPWLLPVARANEHLTETAYRELDGIRRVPRPGIAARCYEDAFTVFRIDEDDTWHHLRAHDRERMFEARYG